MFVPGNSEPDPKAGFTTVWQSLKFLDRLAVRVGHRRLPCISGRVFALVRLLRFLIVGAIDRLLFRIAPF
uniref:Uncharacterized protein n=1 Tax=Rhizobium leguminosarum TaxID=384 RepID=A0A154IRR9_RHILE|nr:hypothetical protein A4A59_35410 [Rhizobium leguminosarum]